MPFFYRTKSVIQLSIRKRMGFRNNLPILLPESESNQVIELKAKNKHNQKFDKQKHQF